MTSLEISEEESRFKRNYRACLNCRVRKVKCDLGPVDSPRDGKCARCLRERKDCVFVDSKRGGLVSLAKKRPGESGEVLPKRPDLEGRAEKPKLPSVTSILNKDDDREPPKPSAPSNHFSTMEGALVFLAKAAGTIAKADERDNIDAREKHEQIEANARQALPEIAVPAPRINPVLNKPRVVEPASSVPAYMQPGESGKRMAMPAAENGYAVRPKASTKLSSIDYIGGPSGILTEDEAERLIDYYFLTMHPFFPHLPRFLQLSTVLSGYPILLCAILTISSRYHPFENNTGTSGGGVPRNIEVHDRLWLYVQRLISQTVWAEASTRSIGTIFAFLLFTEWNPRAIHWRWSDYANKADEAPEQEFAVPLSDEPNLAGLGAMRRSYRMAWMLIGSAVRLAQDMGFMEISSKTFIATHIAEINSVMDISRRSMLAHSLAEVDLDEDEVEDDALDDGQDDDDRIMKMLEHELKRISSEHVLKFTLLQKAQIELLQIMSLGHESLYGYKAQLGGLTQRQNLLILGIISPLINNWGRKYKEFLAPISNKVLRNVLNLQHHWLNPDSKVSKEVAECIEHELFIFEFNYVKLYIYSLALLPSPKIVQEMRLKRKAGKVTLKLDEISKSAKYIEQAFNSANEMLLVAHRVHRLKMLRFMPVRWLTRMVRAVAFIVKCYLTITAHKKLSKTVQGALAASIDNFDSTILSLSLITIDDIIQSIQRAAITLRDCSPDELHLCTRYSNVLMYLCSEMKTKAKNMPNGDDEMFKTYDQQYANMAYESNFNYSPQWNDAGPGTGGSSANTGDNGRVAPGADMSPPETTPLASLTGDSEVMEWFINNKNVGLDFVGPWTEMIEQQLMDEQFSFENAL